MPTSAREGREFFTDKIAIIQPLETVLDFGPGEGTYSILGRHLTPNWTQWIGVEIFEPYVERYDLDQKYDGLLIDDMRGVPLTPYDVGILGDVLEHLIKEDAVNVLKRQARLARFLYVSVPIIPAPQGPSHGNDHEEHLYDWTFEEMTEVLQSLSLWGKQVETYRGAMVGRWWVQTG